MIASSNFSILEQVHLLQMVFRKRCVEQIEELFVILCFDLCYYLIYVLFNREQISFDALQLQWLL